MPRHREASAIKRADFFDTAQDTRQAHALVLGDPALPAAFLFQRDQVETLGHAVGCALQIVLDNTGNKCASDGSLFENVARVMGWEGVQNALHLAGVIDHARQVCPAISSPLPWRSIAPSMPCSIR